MSKRPHSEAFELNKDESLPIKSDGKKHSLDSDEEDSGAEEEKRNIMQEDEIEGEEDGIGSQEGEITITPFNMKEELEEGHFDQQGHYHWKKEQEIRDSWLDNIDWVKVKGRPEDKYYIHKNDNEIKALGDESSSEEDEQEKFDRIKNYKAILEYMEPGETITKTLLRLGASSRISSAERWKRKKAGIVDEGAAKVTRLTELANVILTKTGNMDIYEETYDKISSIIDRDAGKKEDIGLDMYADDFDKKEHASMDKDAPSTSKTEKREDDECSKEQHWEFKWSHDDSESSGPHTSMQMQKWVDEGRFKGGVWVRKHGEDSQFYSSKRMDFELYI